MVGFDQCNNSNSSSSSSGGVNRRGGGGTGNHPRGGNGGFDPSLDDFRSVSSASPSPSSSNAARHCVGGVNRQNNYTNGGDSGGVGGELAEGEKRSRGGSGGSQHSNLSFDSVEGVAILSQRQGYSGLPPSGSLLQQTPGSELHEGNRVVNPALSSAMMAGGERKAGNEGQGGSRGDPMAALFAEIRGGRRKGGTGGTGGKGGNGENEGKQAGEVLDDAKKNRPDPRAAMMAMLKKRQGAMMGKPSSEKGETNQGVKTKEEQKEMVVDVKGENQESKEQKRKKLEEMGLEGDDLLDCESTLLPISKDAPLLKDHPVYGW